MMDYEKKYKEALAWMRELYPGLHGATKEDAEHYFPELREGEDERIRKEIVGVIQKHYPNTPESYRWISWLEKQKEQVTDESEKIAAAYQLGRSDERKQKEQKPAEWSEEDEDMLNCCISSIEEAKENRYAYKETDGDTSYDREIDWLKSLRPSWKPSDKDELMKLKYAGTSTKLD